MTPSHPGSSLLERTLLTRSGRREGQEVRFLCPAHDDTRPSARYHPGKGVWFCDACNAGGGCRDLEARLGLDAHQPEIRTVTGGRSAPPRGRPAPVSRQSAEPADQPLDIPIQHRHGRSDCDAGHRTGHPSPPDGHFPGPAGHSTGTDRRRESTAGTGRHHDSVLATYPYRDAAGRLLYEVVRKSPKAFACRRPDGSGGWTWDLQGVERVLYRLPELLAAVEDGHTLFLVEGEKDADALAELGLAATTNPGGAGKWSPSYTRALQGAHLVLLPDNDEPGRRHMAEVASALTASPGGGAAGLRLLELPDLPPKGDVSDWIAAGRATGRTPEQLRAELLALAAQAQPPAASAPAAPTPLPPSDPPSPRTLPLRLSDVAPAQVEFVWYPYIPVGKLTLLDGDPGQGKTWIFLAIAAAGSLGRGLPHAGPFEPFNTLFLAEDGTADTLRPRLDLLGADCSRIYAHEQAFSLAQPSGLATFEALLDLVRPRLLVLDPISDYLGGHTDIHRANEVSAILRPAVQIAAQRQCALLALRHLTKARQGRPLYAGLGSISFGATARSVLLAGSTAGEPRRHALIHLKANLTPLGPACGYTLGSRFAWTGATNLTAADLLAGEPPADPGSADDEARAFLRDTLARGPLPSREILATAREAGLSERTLRRAKTLEQIEAVRHGFGTGSVWIWHLPSPRLPDLEGCQAQSWQPSDNRQPSDGQKASAQPLPGTGQTVTLSSVTAAPTEGSQPRRFLPSSGSDSPSRRASFCPETRNPLDDPASGPAFPHATGTTNPDTTSLPDTDPENVTL